jgi:hypothetical protein
MIPQLQPKSSLLSPDKQLQKLDLGTPYPLGFPALGMFAPSQNSVNKNVTAFNYNNTFNSYSQYSQDCSYNYYSNMQNFKYSGL